MTPAFPTRRPSDLRSVAGRPQWRLEIDPFQRRARYRARGQMRSGVAADPGADAAHRDGSGLLCTIKRLSIMPMSISRSEEHTSELQSLMRISYAVFCLKKKQKKLTTIAYTT